MRKTKPTILPAILPNLGVQLAYQSKDAEADNADGW